jgi:hypothetical protein
VRFNTKYRHTIFTNGKIILSVLFLLNTFFAQAKIPELNTIIKEKAFAVHINYSDEVLILQKGIIKKFNTKGDLLASYGNIYINKQSKIISQNTFRTILFCEDFGKIIVLDKRFGLVEMIDTYNIENYLISTIGISYDNENLWIWDEIKQALIKINQKGKTIYTTSNINIYTATTLSPYSITEISTKLYVNDTSKGIFIFDNTGTFKKQIPLKNISSFFIKDEILFYIENNEIHTYNLMSFENIKYIDIPTLENLKIGQNIICGTNQEGFVEIWNF